MPNPPGDAPLLATKLFVPPPRENLVARSRLRDRLASMRGGRVTLIAAAAGDGGVDVAVGSGQWAEATANSYHLTANAKIRHPANAATSAAHLPCAA